MSDNTPKRIAACLDACKGMSTDLLENILIMGDTIASRFKRRDETERELVAENDTLRARISELEAAQAVPVPSIPDSPQIDAIWQEFFATDAFKASIAYAKAGAFECALYTAFRSGVAVKTAAPSPQAEPLPDHTAQALNMVGQPLTDEQIDAAVNKARKEWRAKCDEHNQWCDLGDDEKFLLVARAIESAVRAQGDGWLPIESAPPNAQGAAK